MTCNFQASPYSPAFVSLRDHKTVSVESAPRKNNRLPPGLLQRECFFHMIESILLSVK